MDYLCALCGIGKKTVAELDKHVIENHDGRTFSCEVCQKKSYGKKGLNNHMQIHQFITCKVCSKDFNKKAFTTTKNNVELSLILMMQNLKMLTKKKMKKTK